MEAEATENTEKVNSKEKYLRTGFRFETEVTMYVGEPPWSLQCTGLRCASPLFSGLQCEG
jgi:hypothetical protein